MMRVPGHPDEVLQKHGVERVLLLDSYLPGRKYELRIDGHTAITGQNSTGKTSLIRLFPAFFGGEPSQLVKRDTRSKLKRFTEFYLPNRGSYVVFEYRTHAGLNLAAFTTRNDTQQLRIVLISGGYDDALFLDEDNRFRDKDTLGQRARAAARIVHSLTAISKYREIVFGDTRARGRDHARRRFNVFEGYENAGRFSMENVHSILAATTQSDVSIDERLLRKLLLEQARRRIDLADDRFTHININIESLQGWINNSRGLDEVRARIDHAVATLRLAAQFERLGIDEAVLREALRRRGKAVEMYVETQMQIRATKGVDKEKLDQDHDAQKLQHEARVGEHKWHLQEATSERDALLSRREKAIKGGIHDALKIAAELDSRAEAGNQAHRALMMLRSRSKDISREIDAEIEQIKSTCEAQLARLGEQREVLEERSEQRRDRLRREHDYAQRALGRQTQERGQQYQEALTKAREALAEGKKEKELVGADPGLIEKRDQARDRRDAADKGVVTGARTREQAKGLLEEALREKGELEMRLHTRRTQRDALKAEEERLTELLHREGTLLQYVRENVDGWEGTLGAVLNAGTDLLYEKDLKPAPAGSLQNSLFGIEIETSSLSAVDIDARERRRLHEIQEKITGLIPLIEDDDKTLTKLTQSLKELNKDFEHAEREAASLVARANAEEASYQQAKADAEASREARQAQAQEAVDRAQKEAKEADAASREHAEQARKTLDALQKEQHQETKALNDELGRERGLLSEGRKTAIEQKKKAIAHWEDVRKEKLAEAGVSEEKLTEAEQAVKKADAELTDAREADQQARSWRDLQEEIEKKVPGLKRAIQAKSEAIDSLEADWARYEETYRRNRADCVQAIHNAERALEELNQAAMIVARLHERPEVLGAPGALDEATIEAKVGLDIKVLEAQAEELHKALDKHRIELLKSLREFDRLFSRTPSNMCLSFAESQGLSIQIGSGEARDLLEAAAVLKDFYGAPDYWQSSGQHFPPDSHGERLEEVVRGGISYHLELRGFVDGLEELKRQIQQGNRAIKRHFSAMLAHVPSIETIDVEASFDLESVDGYSAAQKAVSAIRRYEEKRNTSGDDRLLPDKDMRHAFEDLIKYLTTRRYDKKVDLLDAVRMIFEVRLTGAEEAIESKHGESLKSAFSTGIGTIVGVVVLIGFLENMRQGLPIAIPWMIDELLRLDEENTRGLLDALSQQKIFLMTTSPDIKPELDACFTRRYALHRVGENGERLATPILVEVDGEQQVDDPFDVLDEDSAAPEVAAAAEEGL